MDRKIDMWVELKNTKIKLNKTSTNEHVPKIEHQIRVVKEIERACKHTLPFKQIPKTTLVAMLTNYALCLKNLK